MTRLYPSKLLLPSAAGALPRPRLSESLSLPSHLVLQAPAGAGKTTFLAQWLPATGLPFIYYRLDEQDRDGTVAAAHLAVGLRRVWPDWELPAVGPVELAAELAGEAARRPPLILALDGLEAAFGQPWLTDFLAILLRYAPPGLSLVLSSRAPLPADLRPGMRAGDLAFTYEEAAAFLGSGGDWRSCWEASGGLPLALTLWRELGNAGWRAALAARTLAAAPPHVPAEIMRGLVAEWLDGSLGLAEFAHRVSVGQPGAEQLWAEVREIHWVYIDHPPAGRERAEALWEQARARGDRALMASAALLIAEISWGLGEFARSTEWFHQAFDLDPQLELLGAHSMVLLLRDQGRLDEAERLARRCIEARQDRGDLVALAMAHLCAGSICMEQGRFDDADGHYAEAERFYRKFSANVAIGVSTLCYRSLVEAARGNAAGFRRLAEEAYNLARGRWRYLAAMCGHVLAAALLAWGERGAAERLLAESYAYLDSIGAKWHLHVLNTVFARRAWGGGALDEARRWFDQALALAAREGYIQFLQSPRAGALPLLTDALIRGVEAPLCQELLVRMGQRALPALLELTGSGDPGARRSAIYPLAALGAGETIRTLLHDPDEAVRDAALLAYHSQVGAAPTVAESRGLCVAALGPLAVTVDGQPLHRWRTAKARDLFAYFLLLGERPVPRDQAIDALWPEADPDSARSLLHTTLYQLRGSLGAVGDGLITFAGGAYRLSAGGLDLDLTRFERLAASADPADWRSAAALYRGDLLEGLDYPWCEGPRTHYRRVFVGLLRRLAAAVPPVEAVEYLQLLLQADPLDEAAHLALMQAYAGQGNRSAALQQYRTLAHLLDDELGLEPGAPVQALYRQLLD